MQIHKIVLLVLQIMLFSLGRILDDISWYSVPVAVKQVYLFQGIGVAAMSINVILQIMRKKDEKGIFKILFFESQLKFIIPWSLVITISIIFFNVFRCEVGLQSQDYFYMDYTGCCINVVQIFLTNLNYSLICNMKAHMVEFVIYQAIIFGQIIFNGDLMIMFIDGLEGHEKDLSILLVSLIIANQILIMDLIFRAAYEDVQRLEEKQQKKKQMELNLTRGKISAQFENSNLQLVSPNKDQ